MSPPTGTIRELRTDFRSIKRKIEEHGQIIITDHGQPAYLLQSVPPVPTSEKASLPDYYARLVKRQPKALSRKQTEKFWEEERR